MTAITVWLRLFLKFDRELVKKLNFNGDFFLLSIIQPSGFRGSDYLDFSALFEQGKYVNTCKCIQVKFKGPSWPKELSKLALYRLILVTLRTICPCHLRMRHHIKRQVMKCERKKLESFVNRKCFALIFLIGNKNRSREDI